MSIQFSGRVSNYDNNSKNIDVYQEYQDAILEWEYGEDPYVEI